MGGRALVLVHGDDDIRRGVGDQDDERPRSVLLGKALHEAIHHTAEIGVVRQFYNAR